MHTKRFDTYFKRWVQFRVGAIPRLPSDLHLHIIVFNNNINDIEQFTKALKPS